MLHLYLEPIIGTPFILELSKYILFFLLQEIFLFLDYVSPVFHQVLVGIMYHRFIVAVIIANSKKKIVCFSDDSF